MGKYKKRLMEKTKEEEAIKRIYVRKKKKPILANHKLPEEQRICGTIRRAKDSPVKNARNRVQLKKHNDL